MKKPLSSELLQKMNANLTQIIRDKLIDHKHYIRQYGEDMPEIRNWKWGANETGKRKSKCK